MSNLIPIEFKSQRILTTKQLANYYEVDAVRIQQNYIRNLDKYVEGIHFYCLAGEELKQFIANYQIDSPSTINSLTLWTERGAFRHAKSLNNDKAWEVYDQLVENYFKSKELKEYSEKLSPQTKLLLQLSESIAKAELEQQEIKRIAVRAQQTVETIKNTIVSNPDNWREDINRKLNKIAQTVGNKFQEVRSESYKTLEQRAGVLLERRLDNKRARMIKEGRSKTVIDKANRLDVIDEDKKLREIYSAIIKELTIKHCA